MNISILNEFDSPAVRAVRRRVVPTVVAVLLATLCLAASALAGPPWPKFVNGTLVVAQPIGSSIRDANTPLTIIQGSIGQASRLYTVKVVRGRPGKRVWLMDAPHCIWLSVSPNGRYALYQVHHWGASDYESVYVKSARGGSPSRIGVVGFITNVLWSPDSEYAFIAEANKTRCITVIQARTGDARQFTLPRNRAIDTSNWSRDSRHVILSLSDATSFHRLRDSSKPNSDFYTMDVQAKSPEFELTAPKPATDAEAYGLLSPQVKAPLSVWAESLMYHTTPKHDHSAFPDETGSPLIIARRSGSVFFYGYGIHVHSASWIYGGDTYLIFSSIRGHVFRGAVPHDDFDFVIDGPRWSADERYVTQCVFLHPLTAWVWTNPRTGQVHHFWLKGRFRNTLLSLP